MITATRTWQLHCIDWPGAATHGVRLYAARPDGRGRWLPAEALPVYVLEQLHARRTHLADGTAHWTLPYETVTELVAWTSGVITWGTPAGGDVRGVVITREPVLAAV